MSDAEYRRNKGMTELNILIRGLIGYGAILVPVLIMAFLLSLVPSDNETQSSEVKQA